MATVAKSEADVISFFLAYLETVIERSFKRAAKNNYGRVPVFTGAARAALMGNLDIQVPVGATQSRHPRFQDKTKGIYSWSVGNTLDYDFNTDALLAWTGKSATVDYFTYFDTHVIGRKGGWGYREAMYKDFDKEFDRIIDVELENKLMGWLGYA